jgi:hypothetical protein
VGKGGQIPCRSNPSAIKTAAAKSQVDLHPGIAEYLQGYATGRLGSLFHTANSTPHLYGNLEALFKMQLVKTKPGAMGAGREATELKGPLVR